MFGDFINLLMDFGLWGMFIHSFIDAIFFPVPAFFLQVSLSIIDPSSALWLATVGYIACLMGTPFGYLIGKFVGKSFLEKILKKEWVEKASNSFQRNGEAAILIGSFTPIPFKVFTILSGSLNFSFWKLMGYAAIGRAAKFYVVGALFYMYGRSAEGVVKEYLTYIFLGVAGILVLFLVLKRSVQKKKEKQLIRRDEHEQQAG